MWIERAVSGVFAAAITPVRDTKGYSAFQESDAHRLTVLGRARVLGFTIKNRRALLDLWEDKSRANADMRAIFANYLKEIEVMIADLTAMRDTQTDLVQTCARNNRPHSPILPSPRVKEGSV